MDGVRAGCRTGGRRVVDALPCCWSGGGRPTEATGPSSPHAFSPHWTSRNRPLSGVFFLFPLPVNGAREGEGRDCCGSCPLSCCWRVVQRGPLGELAGAGLLFPPSPLAALRVGGDDCRAVFPSPFALSGGRRQNGMWGKRPPWGVRPLTPLSGGERGADDGER